MPIRLLSWITALLSMGALSAGCMWSSGGTVQLPPLYSGPSAILDVEYDSSRSVSGEEHVTTYVYPNDRDSVQFILVNGTMVYRASPPFMDSLAPYRLDSALNVVTIVWPHVSKTDSERMPITRISIFNPAPGDTVDRSKGFTLRYTPRDNRWTRSYYLTLSDAVDSVFRWVDTSGVYQVADTDLARLHGSVLHVSLNDFDSFSGLSGENEYTTFVNSNRTVDFPMR